MIFVTAGNHFQGFERLLEKVDEIAPRIPHEIIVQKGYSKYVPHNTKYFDFVPANTATEYIRKSELVVSHAGMGTIILSKQFGTPIVILPRRKIYGEHVNDHQMEIAQVLEERKDANIHVIYEEGQLEKKVMELLENKVKVTPKENVGRANLIKTIRAFIQENER
jgi:UDP-N-acetylglucosamine transferase subunit ALG13